MLLTKPDSRYHRQPYKRHPESAVQSYGIATTTLMSYLLNINNTVAIWEVEQQSTGIALRVN